MKSNRQLRFTGLGARVQYLILMALFCASPTRGFYGRAARGLGRIFGAENAVLVREGNDPWFRISLNDGYWTRFGLYYREYEPEIGQILIAASGATPAFLDLGANKGYWTLRASARFARVIAVEASRQTFAALKQNCASLGNVDIRQAAVHNKSGQVLKFINTYLSHASARLLANETAGQNDVTETVTTVAIDDLIAPGETALIKLDVEGAEIAAIDGGHRALLDGSVLIYEDHGSDTACLPSAHLLGVPEMCLYYCGTAIERMTSIEQIQAIKTDAFKGYNFVAAKRNSKLMQGILKSLQSGA